MLVRSSRWLRVAGYRAFSGVAGHSINDPQVLEEVKKEFLLYESALCKNDVKALDRFFFDNPSTVRFGTAENLYGYEAIRAFREGRSPPGDRRILRSLITTYGPDFAVANLEFQRDGSSKIGRQSQTWLRTPGGWKVVSAHVSMMEK
mmetsp:Transcript_67306/g.139591  ORF Transcript_67306/g.139591 Transcript_67306/m.139591 type:complete len:147 (+) Transcript_67306:42-482(+)|eukprot:s5091_g7.t1